MIVAIETMIACFAKHLARYVGIAEFSFIILDTPDGTLEGRANEDGVSTYAENTPMCEQTRTEHHMSTTGGTRVGRGMFLIMIRLHGCENCLICYLNVIDVA